MTAVDRGLLVSFGRAGEIGKEIGPYVGARGRTARDKPTERSAPDVNHSCGRVGQMGAPERPGGGKSSLAGLHLAILSGLLAAKARRQAVLPAGAMCGYVV